ncbi:crossover junction endodeoxyribonuclease RuvC [Desulfobacterales bacterium HSG2]|nr:crossover junction endodeoxyribonuclease RuvC [Desulfobacterales bacterium HSG2]
MKVIGIDPGLAATGVGIVRGKWLGIDGYAFGDVHTSAKTPLPDRLNRIFSKLLLVLEDEKPDLMVVEDVFSVEKYPKSGITLGKVTGVILLAGCHKNVPIIEVSVREAKQILTGNGNATKKQLEISVRHMLNLETPIKSFHASDAMAMALIGLFRWQM